MSRLMKSEQALRKTKVGYFTLIGGETMKFPKTGASSIVPTVVFQVLEHSRHSLNGH